MFLGVEIYRQCHPLNEQISSPFHKVNGHLRYYSLCINNTHLSAIKLSSILTQKLISLFPLLSTNQARN